MARPERRLEFKDPFKRQRWSGLIWTLTLLGALFLGWHAVEGSADNYYANIESAAGE